MPTDTGVKRKSAWTSEMAEWGAQHILSTKSSNKTEQNCLKQPFKDSGNWPEAYNKLRNVYQENLLKLSKSSRSLWHFA